MALVEQLGDDGRLYKYAACCRMILLFQYLPLCIYITSLILLFLSIPFLNIFL